MIDDKTILQLKRYANDAQLYYQCGKLSSSEFIEILCDTIRALFAAKKLNELDKEKDK